MAACGHFQALQRNILGDCLQYAVVSYGCQRLWPGGYFIWGKNEPPDKVGDIACFADRYESYCFLVHAEIARQSCDDLVLGGVIGGEQRAADQSREIEHWGVEKGGGGSGGDWDGEKGEWFLGWIAEGAEGADHWSW